MGKLFEIPDYRGYQWLSQIYINVPRKPLLAEFDPTWFDAFGIATMQMAIDLKKCLDSLSDENMQDIAVDHTSLFSACIRDAPYPYESIFASETPLLMQDARTQVLKHYSEFGYRTELEKCFEPEDHIYFELGFVAFLYKRAASLNVENAQHYIDAAHAFQIEHLASWVPKFSEAVQKMARTDFMIRSAILTAAIMQQEGSSHVL